MIWAKSFFIGYLTAYGIPQWWNFESSRSCAVFKVFLWPFVKKSAFQRKKSSLLPLLTERMNARLQSLSIFTTPLCKRSKMLQKHHLSELAVRTTSQGWISTSGQVSRSPCKLSNHCLEQLWYIVTTCLFTLPGASACSQYATGWRSHLRYRPQWGQAHHPALSLV